MSKFLAIIYEEWDKGEVKNVRELEVEEIELDENIQNIVAKEGMAKMLRTILEMKTLEKIAKEAEAN